MKDLSSSLFPALCVAAFVGCDREPPAPAPAPPGSAVTVTVEVPALPERLRFRKEPSAQGMGMPAGCRMALPTRTASLPKGDVRFITNPIAPEELLLVVAQAGKPSQAGLFPLDGASRGRVFPWTDLDTPPALARSDAGWLAAVAGGKGGSLQTVDLWREARPAERLAEGDQLSASDLVCSGRNCALLTTRVSKSAGPGASVFLGAADTPASAWRRIDLSPEGADQTSPFAVLDARPDGARVALLGEGVEVWEAKLGGATRTHRMEVEHDVFDVFLADVPVVVTAGAVIEEPCRKDGFPLVMQRADGPRFTATIPVAPENLVTRPLDNGFIVAWLAPMSCRVVDRSMIHALLLDSRGEPKSSAMAVAEGSAFALSTRGSTADIWLQRGQTMTWASGTCLPGRPSPSPTLAPSAPSVGSAFNSPSK